MSFNYLLMEKNLNKLQGILLFLLIMAFPFSYSHLSIKWLVLLTFVVLFLGITLLIQKKGNSEAKGTMVAISLIFLVVFEYAEKLSFIQLFNVPVELRWRLPVSTVLIALSIAVFFLKACLNRNIKFIDNTFTRYFLYSNLFIIGLMALLFPFLWNHYQMKASLDLGFLNTMIKYMMVLIIVGDYLSTGKKTQKLAIGLAISLSLAVVLKLVI